MFRRNVARFLAIASLATLGILIPGPAPARAAADTWVVCQAIGAVSLYTDESKTTLVDAFSVVNAPTRHRLGSGDFVIQGDQAGPGVEVIGTVTGTHYVFEMRSGSMGIGPNPGSIQANIGRMDWRVTAAGGGVVADARYLSVRVYRDNEEVVVKVFGPVHHGLYLSGNLGIYCPQF